MVIKGLDRDGIDPLLDGIAVGFRDSKDQVDEIGIIGRICVGRREFQGDAARFDFDFLEGQPFGEGDAFEEIGFLIDLQLLVLEVLQPEYCYGSQIDISCGTVSGFVGGLDLEFACLGDLVSRVEGLGCA